MTDGFVYGRVRAIPNSPSLLEVLEIIPSSSIVSQAIPGAITLEQFAPGGTVFNGTTDATPYWLLALAAAAAAVAIGTGPKAILLGANREYPTTVQLNVPAGVEIIGQGETSIVSTPNDINVFRVHGDEFHYERFKIRGTGVGANQIGIANQPVGAPAASGFLRGRIIHMTFDSLATAGYLSYQLPGPPPYFSTYIAGLRAENCGIALWLLGEYCTVLGMQINACTTAVEVEGGNQVYIGGTITSCTNAVQLDGGGNDGHGVWLGVEMNHNVHILKTTGTLTNTQYFRDCEMYYGSIDITWTGPSSAVIFDACQMDPQAVNLGSNANVVFQGNNWPQQTVPGPPPFTLAPGVLIRFDAMNTDQSGNLPAFIETLAGASTTAFRNMLQGVTLITPQVAAPAAAAVGFVLYVDVADGKLKAIGPGGTITPLANP